MRNGSYACTHRQLYEIKAQNGQVLEHGITSQAKCRTIIKDLKRRYPEDHFTIWGYDKGKYGNE